MGGAHSTWGKQQAQGTGGRNSRGIFLKQKGCQQGQSMVGKEEGVRYPSDGHPPLQTCIVHRGFIHFYCYSQHLSSVTNFLPSWEPGN